MNSMMATAQSHRSQTRSRKRSQRRRAERSRGLVGRIWSRVKTVVMIISGLIIVVAGGLQIILLTVPELDTAVNLIFLTQNDQPSGQTRQDDQVIQDGQVVMLSLQPHRSSAYWFAFNPDLPTPALASSEPLEVRQLRQHFAQHDQPQSNQPTNEQDQPAAGRHFTRAGYSAVLSVLLDDVFVLDSLPDQPTNLQLWWWLVQRAPDLVSQGASWQQLWAWSGFVFQLSADELTSRQITNWPDWRDQRLTLQLPTRLGCEVAVVNATQTSGLATAVTELLEANQLEVIRLANAPEPDGRTRLITAQADSCQRELELLGAVTPAAVTPSVDQTTSEQYRSPLVLFLGSAVEQAWQGILAPDQSE